MDVVLNFFKNFATAWPSILMGALIPCGVLAVLLFGKNRKQTAFKAVGFGFATFFAALVVVGILLLVLGSFFLPSISASASEDANGYIFLGGGIVLALFYVCTEALKCFSFRSVIKTEKNLNAGLTFGCGFILAQNLLIIGLSYISEVDIMQMIGFGILMVISGVIYLLNSYIGYTLIREGSWITGSAMAVSYFLIFAVMLFFANMYVTYGFVAFVLIFNLVLGYFLLKKGAKGNG